MLADNFEKQPSESAIAGGLWVVADGPACFGRRSVGFVVFVMRQVGAVFQQ